MNDWRRWWRTAKGVWIVSDERHLGLISAGVAFFAMLGIFPGVAAIVALWGFVSDPAVIDTQIQVLTRFLPADAYALVDGQVGALIAANNSNLGWATLFSIGAALWSARAGVGALIQGVNAVFGAQNRGGVVHAITALVLTLVLVGVVLVSLAAVIVMPILLAFFPLGSLANLAATIVKWALVLAVVVFGIGLVYRYGPNRSSDRVAMLSPGLVLAVLLWAGASVGFSYFLANFGSYNRIYGSIGAAIALLMWFYISSYVVLLGAAVNAEWERAAPDPADPDLSRRAPPPPPDDALL